jgi:hypothetical protein
MSRSADILTFLLLGLLSLAIAASVGITMRLNYLFVVSMVEDAEKKVLLGWGTVIADLWKACGLIFVPLLWRWKRYAMAGCAAFVWLLCFVWAVASLLGSVAHERMATTGGREIIHANYADTEKELIEAEEKRKGLRSARPASEIEALVGLALSRPLNVGARTRTVDELSRSCSKPDRVTAEMCSDIGELRAEMAAAVESARLDARVAELRKRAAVLREQGATLSPDVQGQMISWFTRGFLSAKDTALGLPLLVTAVFEAIGALCPAIVFAVIEGTRRPAAPPIERGAAQATQASAKSDASVAVVVDFLDDCTEPRDDGVALGLSELYAEYQSWCQKRGGAPLALPAFAMDLDRERKRPEMKDRVRKFGDRYYGIGLVRSKAPTLLAGRVGKLI